MHEINKNINQLSRREAVRAAGVIALGVYCGTRFEAAADEGTGPVALCTVDTIPSESEMLDLEAIEPDDTVPTDQYEVAQKYGFNLASKESIDEIISLIDEATSAEEVISCVSAFTEAEYSFPFQVPYAMDISLIRDRAKGFLSNISLLPKEFFETIQITAINLALKDDLEGTSGRFTYKTRAVDVALESLDSPHVLYHELVGHGAGSISCGRAEDAAMLSVNEGAPQYTYNSEIALMLPRAVDVYATEYSMMSPEEDSAEIIALWMLNRVDLHESKRGTPLYEKTALVLDRINTLLPNFVHYVEEAVQPHFAELDQE